MTTPLDGRSLADELDNPQSTRHINLLEISAALRALSDKLEATLKVANDLSESMDSVHTDRVMLADMVKKLTDELEAQKGKTLESAAF